MSSEELKLMPMPSLGEFIDWVWQLKEDRDAARAQLAAIQGGMGEVVGFDRNAAYAACPESGCDWGSFYVGWKAAAAQHQRITAAMAAEVERLSQQNGDPAGSFEKCMEAMRDRDEHARTIDALRAELAEVKGREAVAWIVPDFGFLFPTEDAAQRYLRNINDLRKPTALYTTPQPGPDVRSLLSADDVRDACANAVSVFAEEANAAQCREVAEYMREVLLAQIAHRQAQRQ